MPKSEQHIFFKKISHTYLIRLLHVHVVQYGRLMQKILFTIEHTIFVVLCFPGYITWICCIQKVFGYLVFYSLLFCHQNSRLFVMSFSKRSNGQFVAEQVFSRTSGSSQNASLQAPPNFINAKFWDMFPRPSVVFTNKRSQAGVSTVYFTLNIWKTTRTIVHVLSLSGV